MAPAVCLVSAAATGRRRGRPTDDAQHVSRTPASNESLTRASALLLPPQSCSSSTVMRGRVCLALPCLALFRGSRHVAARRDAHLPPGGRCAWATPSYWSGSPTRHPARVGAHRSSKSGAERPSPTQKVPICNRSCEARQHQNRAGSNVTCFPYNLGTVSRHQLISIERCSMWRRKNANTDCAAW